MLCMSPLQCIPDWLSLSIDQPTCSLQCFRIGHGVIIQLRSLAFGTGNIVCPATLITHQYTCHSIKSLDVDSTNVLWLCIPSFLDPPQSPCCVHCTSGSLLYFLTKGTSHCLTSTWSEAHPDGHGFLRTPGPQAGTNFIADQSHLAV